MKKASKKLFKSPTKSSGGGINGHSSFSSAAATALSLSPVAEDDGDFHKAFYNEQAAGRGGDAYSYRNSSSSYDKQSSSHSSRDYDPGTVRKHPHEIDREVTSDELRAYDEAARRRRHLQEEQLERWSKHKSSASPGQSQNSHRMSSKGRSSSGHSRSGSKGSGDDHSRTNSRGSSDSGQLKSRHKKHPSHEAYNNDYGTHNKEVQEQHRRMKSTPTPPFTSDDFTDQYNVYAPSTPNKYTDEGIDGEDESYTLASSKQKKTIDNYVQSVIAHANSPEYVTPMPRMDSTSSDFFSNTDDSEDRRGSDENERSASDSNLLPLPGFGEVDLLQRAIERRALLHDRIVKMEAASAEFAREENERALRKQQQSEGRHHGKKNKRRSSVEEDNDRMNEISERIKAEALEFLRMDESDNLTEEASNATGDGSDVGEDPPEDIDLQSRQSLRHELQGETILDQGPTPAQLARYGNMVRLGIPDLAIFRSMERDGIDSSRGSGILESLKHKHHVESGERGVNSAPLDELDIGEASTEQAISPQLSSTPVQSRKDSLPPLKDDPNYNKYFKMLKAKVPMSWVKRVLEVDGKDARVLDLDPDRPMAEQVAGAGVDEYGNIDWSKVVIFRTGSDKSVDSSGDELIGRKQHVKRLSAGSSSSNIQLETSAAVKAELALMTAKAAGRSYSQTSSRQSSLTRDSDSSIDAKEVKPNPADITSAAVAASNARLSRLKAMTTPDRAMRRKQSVDEIRRRPPPPPPRTPKSSHQIPQSPSANSATSNEPFKTSRRQTYEHLPLKDDPRFSKYFQMIRSRVPRSWVERVIEVDDRDPAILDLDPNKPLAAQVDDDDSKSMIRTLATEMDGSLDESVRSGVLDSSGMSRTSEAYHIKNDSALSPTEEVEEENPPPAKIVNAVDDERSVASSITNFKDAGGSQAEQSNAVLDRISAFLDKIEARTRSEEVSQPAGEASDNRLAQPSHRLSNPEDIENKLSSLIERFDSRGSQQQQTPEQIQSAADEQQQFIEENQSDITKLTALLASKLGQQADATETSEANDQSDLAKLSSLLTEVLSKMDDSSPSDQENKEPTDNSPPPGKLGKNAALEALFAKRAALAEGAEPPILRVDPEYQKYFKMQKLGMPRPTIEQALERDGKDISILDMDPDRPLAEQLTEKGQPNKNAALEALFASRAAAMQQPKKNDVPLKNDPEYQKYFKMLKVGMPRDAVVQALERDGKSASILDLDPEKPYGSQNAKSSNEARDELEERKTDFPLKDDPDFAKFFKMLKMGIPLGAVEQALQKEGKDRAIASMDPNKSYSSQVKEREQSKKTAHVALKDNPEFAKFFKMLKMGIPLPAVKQALMKEGKDPGIIDMDPDKPLVEAVPLKDCPEYSKFFRMLKMGIPLPAVKQALQKEGKDPSIIDMDPEKPFEQQQSKPEEKKQPVKANNGPKVARKRLHWNKIDESKLNEKSFWNQAKGEHASLQLVGLDIDNEEFASLFTSQVNKSAAPKKDPAAEAKKSPGKQKVQLIDGRRRMNGSILLTKFKVDYKLLAKQVDNMEYVKAEGNELRGMMQLLPTKDESLALRSYLPPADAPQSEIDEAIDKLGECEQYMAVMLDVPDAKEKFQCMLFRAEFEQQVDSIRDGTKLLIDACDSVQNSERFKKLLMYALKLGNALNTDASGAEATAITLDSLLKLAEAKAFDRKTSVLHYLVSIVSKNDEDVLKLSEDFVPVKAAERVAVDMLSQQIKELTNGIELIKEMAKKYAPQNESTEIDAEEEIPEDELLSATPMGKFSLSAESKITSLTKNFAEAKVYFADLLEFFGEDLNLTPEAFFCTINTFVSMFDQTYKELKRKEEAKERKKRIEEKRKLREEATKQGKAT